MNTVTRIHVIVLSTYFVYVFDYYVRVEYLLCET